MLQVSMNILYI